MPGAAGRSQPIMSPKLRLISYLVLGAALGIEIGINLSNESYGLAVLILLIASWMVTIRASPTPPDAWLLTIALVGYIVGNRGFAQLQPSPMLPLLPAEGVLAVAIPMLLARVALKKATAWRKDALNYSVIIWMLIGAIRLPLDISRYGVLALRDFATIYYAAFFFIAQALGSRKPSEKVLTRGLTVAFVGLLPVVVSILIWPDFLVDNLTWRGIPIIYHKSDLIATSLAAGFFWLWTRWTKSRRRIWLLAATSSLLLIALMASPRAGMFAVAVTTVIWVFTGQWRIAAYQIGVVAAAAVISVAATSLTGLDITTSVPYSMYEHTMSMFDPAGTGTYINNESGDLGGNNQFRLIWWRDVVEDTISQSPLLGLGFGADLSSRFLADYDLLGDETFAARSPHSLLVTVIGRMGFVGLAAWIAVSVSIAALVWRLLKSRDPDGMGLASVVAVVWLSACFGVVLEGPMGAVIFWTALGLANARMCQVAAKAPIPTEVDRAEGTSEHWPVAKAGAFDTQAGNP